MNEGPLDFNNCYQYVLAVWHSEHAQWVNEELFKKLYNLIFFSLTASIDAQKEERYVFTTDYNVRVKNSNGSLSFISLGGMFLQDVLNTLPQERRIGYYNDFGYLVQYRERNEIEGPLRRAAELISNAITEFYQAHEENQHNGNVPHRTF